MKILDKQETLVRFENIGGILGPLPNAEVYNNYLQRAKNYAISVLAPGGLVASKGITVTAKFKKFFLAATGKQKLLEITLPQWEALWTVLDSLATQGKETAVAAVQEFCCSHQTSDNVKPVVTEQPMVTLEIDGTEVDLTVPAPTPWPGTVAAWVDEVARVSTEVTNVQFYFGDLLNQGIAAFGEVDAYYRAMLVSGKDRETLRFYSWVAKKVPPARRVKELTFNHHRAVAALDQGCQAILLARAVEENLTVKDVQEIAACKSTTLTPSAVAATRGVHCLVPVSIYKDLEKFATDWKCTVAEVVQRAVVKYMLERRAAARQELKAMETLIPGANDVA